MKHKSLLIIPLLASILAGCVGDTGDNGQAEVTDPLVADGAAGGALEIILNDSDGIIGVGQRVGFFVRATDAQGSPTPFLRIICDSERGVSILEPSRGGVAVEMTGENGEMSGQIGGLTPGSYVLECRSQQGFNLRDRVTVIVSGTAPNGFTGFPGAAGGNLGGGRLQ
jgi:hypothetical protein